FARASLRVGAGRMCERVNGVAWARRHFSNSFPPQEARRCRLALRRTVVPRCPACVAFSSTSNHGDEVTRTKKPTARSFAGETRAFAVVLEDLNAKFGVFGEALQGLRSEVAEVRSEVAEVRSEVGALQSLPQGVAALQSEVAALQSKVGALQSKVGALQSLPQ